MDRLSGTALFTPADLPGTKGLGLGQLVALVEAKKKERLDELAKDYAALTPLLLKARPLPPCPPCSLSRNTPLPFVAVGGGGGGGDEQRG